MDVVWSIFLFILTVVVECVIKSSRTKSVMELPFSKTLGFSILENLENSLQRFEHGYMDMYNEMLKASQEATGTYKEDGDFGVDLIRIKEAAVRRRSVRLRTAIGQRRSRSQALRREKLNSQSLRSHLQHTKQSSSSVEDPDKIK